VPDVQKPRQRRRVLFALVGRVVGGVRGGANVNIGGDVRVCVNASSISNKRVVAAAVVVVVGGLGELRNSHQKSAQVSISCQQCGLFLRELASTGLE